jgi:ankyrin repeat protein
MLGGSFIEFLKRIIKAKQNESVIKMLELAKDKPETYLELLPVAIFHQNFEIIKYMLTNFKIMEINSLYKKASSFYNSILSEDSKDKINDWKDYMDAQISLVLMCGIGGDIQIFKYLLDKELISNINQTVVIGLSKKFKNSFNSNIIGDCAYYGKKELLEYLLKNYKDLDLNKKSTEKKIKNTKFNFTKEFTGCTPSMLSMVGPISDIQTLEILKILHKFGANFKVCDFNKENLLHLATKNKKIESSKYLIDELK